MHSTNFISLFIFSTVLAAAQTLPVPIGDAVDHDKPIRLETLVVTGNPDARSAFDLAQGASVLTGHQLHLDLQATLGETLANTPGVNATYYGPGASRPSIRGLGGDRVRMLDNGIGSLDASNVSPDHNVSVEPLLLERIEVLRGPATLLYGSSAVGGVVNVIDNRIPSSPPDHPLSAQIEARHGSAANERTGIIALTSGNDRFAVRANALRTRTDDVNIPGYADPTNPVNRGTLTNSGISTTSGTVGATTFWSSGNAGAAVSEYDSVYGVPVGEPINIDMKQRRVDLRVESSPETGPFKSIKARFGLADYRHAEIDTTTGLANTRFRNQAYEGRLELIQREAGKLSGTVGTQFTRSDFSAVGEEVVTPPSVTSAQALFVLESLRIGPQLTLQFGGRLERQKIKLGDVDPGLPAYPGYAATSGEKRTERGMSFSTGAVIYPVKDWSIGVSAAYSQRNPTAQELFSHGPHGGTGSYEIGTSSLGQEKSLGLDLNVRKRSGFMEGSIGVFLNRFQNYIFEQEDATTYFDEDSGSFLPYPAPPEAGYLPIYQFVARDAVFYGAEAEVTFHLIDTEQERLHLELKADNVHAQQTTDDQPLPRMPPVRAGFTLSYERGPWDLGLSLRHAFAHNRTAPGETSTDGYTLFGANASYRWVTPHAEWELFAQGKNLGNTVARVSTSFLKAIAPLPGRNLDIGVRMNF
ncbi:MAG: TonB-dependent receptor [Cephaloticoccus sp.]|nr:TonB-dependent receptor [Cephaloticoccus sp.]MCF7761557.1 TonB-dependent receptor [Cephaloticoccus sp.]